MARQGYKRSERAKEFDPKPFLYSARWADIEEAMTTLLRGPTTWATERPFVRALVTRHRLGWQVASRFVAGDTLEAGMDAARSLHRQGITTMLDYLGENVTRPSQAAGAADAYIRALKRIREWADLDANISVKLSQLGLDLSTELCLENMERVLQVAAEAAPPTLVMIDMEGREYVDRTLHCYLALRDRYPIVGICLQAYLHRTARDALRIAGPAAIVRMAKGAYLEPPEVAFASRKEVRRNLARISATLLVRGSLVHFATHDPSLIAGAKRFVRARSFSRARYEFQMLYGIRRDLQADLVREGEPVRVYVPYGTEWYPYLTRRLAERPANAWFFASQLLRRGG
jgi:proline dehydrogenase